VFPSAGGTHRIQRIRSRTVASYRERVRTTILALTALTALALTGCGPDKAAQGSPPASSAPSTVPSAATTSAGSGADADTSGLDGIAFPPGATVTDLGTNQKQYAVTGMSLDQVKDFFEVSLISKGYVRAQELSASRFYDKGAHRIQVTWSDQQGTIRGVVRVLR